MNVVVMYLVGVLGAVLVFLAAILIHEFGHMWVAKQFGVGVVEYSFGMGPALWSKRIKDTVYSIRMVPFGGYCAMYGEQSSEAEGKGEERPEKKRRFHFGVTPDFKTDWREDQNLNSKTWWQRLLIYLAGPFMNIVLGVVACMVMVVFFSAASVPLISAVNAGYPAAEVGIQAGDVIVGVEDRDVWTLMDYSEYLDTHTELYETGFDIHVWRDGAVYTYEATVAEDGMFGIEIESVPVELTPYTLFLYTGNTVRYMFNMIVDSVHMIAAGTADWSDMSGVVGVTALIAGTVDQASVEGLMAILGVLVFMLAFLCINLGVINMLPFPALDGGRTVLCLIEGLRRKPLSEKVEYSINFVGMCMLLMLLVYTLINDLLRVFSGSFLM